MKLSLVRSSKVFSLGATLLCLLVLAISLVGCGESSTPTTATTAPSTNSNASTSATTATVTITEKTGTHDIYTFSPAEVTIKAGGTVKWIDNSDENHLFASDTAGVFTATSIVMRDGSADNTYTATFSNPGTYKYTSTLVQRKGGQTEGETNSAMGTITVTR